LSRNKLCTFKWEDIVDIGDRKITTLETSCDARSTQVIQCRLISFSGTFQGVRLDPVLSICSEPESGIRCIFCLSIQ
jgi:hypothetical protein